METFLELIRGKKTTIATILGAILVFVLGRGYITADLATLISAILVAVGLGVNIKSAKINK